MNKVVATEQSPYVMSVILPCKVRADIPVVVGSIVAHQFFTHRFFVIGFGKFSYAAVTLSVWHNATKTADSRYHRVHHFAKVA